MQEPTRQTPLNTVTTSATPFTPNGMSRASSAWRSAFMTCLLVGLSACSCGDPELTPDGGFSDVEGGVESLEGTCGEKGTVCCPPAPGGCGLNLLCKGAPKGTEDTCCVAVASKCDSTTDCCPGYTCDDGKFEECLSPIGGACTGSADCIADAYCPNGQCKPAPEGEGGEGEDCIEVEGGDLQCQKGFVCEEDASGETGKCVACGGLDGDQGQPCCDGSKGCADLFFCNPDNKCQEPKEDGEGDACSEDEPCFNDSLKCVDGTCQRTPQPGDPNSECPGEFSPCCDGNKCGSGLVCDPITDRCMDPVLITSLIGGILIKGCGTIFCCPWLLSDPGDKKGEDEKNPLFTCEGNKKCNWGLCVEGCKDLGKSCDGTGANECCSLVDVSMYSRYGIPKGADDDEKNLQRVAARCGHFDRSFKHCCVGEGSYCEESVHCCGRMRCDRRDRRCVANNKGASCWGDSECKEDLVCVGYNGGDEPGTCGEPGTGCSGPPGNTCDPTATSGNTCCDKSSGYGCQPGDGTAKGKLVLRCCSGKGSKCNPSKPGNQCCSGVCESTTGLCGGLSGVDGPCGTPADCTKTVGGAEMLCINGQCALNEPAMCEGKTVGATCSDAKPCCGFLQCDSRTGMPADNKCRVGKSRLCRKPDDCVKGFTCTGGICAEMPTS